MPIIEYSSDRFEALQQFVDRLGLPLGLAHRPFVDYYYASGDWCRLSLYVSNDGSVLATYGLERMRFEYKGREMIIGLGENFYSLQPGTAGILFVRAHTTCPVGLVYGGSEDTHKMIRARKWGYYNGVRVRVLNRAYEAHPGDGWLRIAARSMARQIARSKLSNYVSRIPAEVRKQMSVREEHVFARDLLPDQSPFIFRFAPSIEHLNWRYNTGLSFVRYRIFRLLEGGRTVGYAVINESPEKLIVAHCDGIDARTLAYGVLLSVLEVGREDRKPRTVILASSHPTMQEIYQRFGFRSGRTDRQFCIGTLRGPVDIESDTSDWLVNFDWGDNGLRPPFLDQPQNGSNRQYFRRNREATGMI